MHAPPPFTNIFLASLNLYNTCFYSILVVILVVLFAQTRRHSENAYLHLGLAISILRSLYFMNYSAFANAKDSVKKFLDTSFDPD